MSLDTKIFIDMMIHKYYKHGKWKILNDALIEAGAIIAGGAVLYAYHQDSRTLMRQSAASAEIDEAAMNDVDIYIHASKTLQFVEDLSNQSINYHIAKGNYIAPAYDQSFFRKNNILARFTLKQKHWEYLNNSPDIDIIIIIPIYHIMLLVKLVKFIT